MKKEELKKEESKTSKEKPVYDKTFNFVDMLEHLWNADENN